MLPPSLDILHGIYPKLCPNLKEQVTERGEKKRTRPEQKGKGLSEAQEFSVTLKNIKTYLLKVIIYLNICINILYFSSSCKIRIRPDCSRNVGQRFVGVWGWCPQWWISTAQFNCQPVLNSDRSLIKSTSYGVLWSNISDIWLAFGNSYYCPIFLEF